jgi:tripartite-type tricarboxylate transporter receptor subunit TctC
MALRRWRILGLLILLFPTVVYGQEFPRSAVRIIVPFPPGGPADAVARLLGEKLALRWRQAVLIDNRPGANTIIGAQAVAGAPADGHTLLMAAESTLTMNQTLFKSLPYDPVRDFAPVTLASSVPLVLLVRTDAGVASVRELVAAAKADPAKWSFGAGTISTQLAGELFNRFAGTKLTYIPYKGSGGTFPAILGGQVPVIFDGLGPAVPYVKAGKLLALATSAPKRVQLAPEVPTFIEQGFPDYDLVAWVGIVAPSRTAAATVQKLSTDINAVLALGEVRERFLNFGMEAVGTTPEAFRSVIRRDTERFGRLLNEFGIRLE